MILKSTRTYIVVLFHSEVVAPVGDLKGPGQLLGGQEGAVVGEVGGHVLRGEGFDGSRGGGGDPVLALHEALASEGDLVVGELERGLGLG